MSRVRTSSSAASEEVELPVVRDGELATVLRGEVLDKLTRAPALYTEATLLADMEHASKFVDDPSFRKALRRTSGLGTPATQAATIEGLKHDGLIELEKRSIRPTEKGRLLIQWLPPETYSIERTARWETELSLIEKTGDSAPFMAEVRAEVQRTVAALRTLPAPPPLSSAAAEPARSSGEFMSGAPSDKMRELAEKIEKRTGRPLPPEVLTSFQACRKFLDEHASAMSAPSPKALDFADTIAKRKGVKVPPAALKDASKLSDWINKNR